MIDSIKKTVLAGVGAALATTDKVQASLDEFVKQGKVSAADARSMAEKIAKQSRKEFDVAASQLHETFSSLMDHTDKKLQARVDALELRVEELEAKSDKHKHRTAKS